jgi:hypothetical protein
MDPIKEDGRGLADTVAARDRGTGAWPGAGIRGLGPLRNLSLTPIRREPASRTSPAGSSSQAQEPPRYRRATVSTRSFQCRAHMRTAGANGPARSTTGRAVGQTAAAARCISASRKGAPTATSRRSSTTSGNAPCTRPAPWMRCTSRGADPIPNVGPPEGGVFRLRSGWRTGCVTLQRRWNGPRAMA